MPGDRDGALSGIPAGGERIGHYTILAELGEDELGFFLGAVDERLDRTVVLRVSRPAEALGDVAQEVRSPMREGASLATHLNHPNLVTVYEYLPLQGADLVALEQVEGDTLEQLHLRGERWTVLDVARMVARLADALAAAHAEGIAHGRVGAANVKVRPDGRVKLLDLGLPREIGADGHVLRPEPGADVAALAGLACELLAPPGAEVVGWPTLLADPVRARAAFGFLTPVLARGVGSLDQPGFDSAAEFRDAVLLALESAAGRGGRGGEGRGIEPSFSTRVIGPAAAMSDVLPEDGRALAALGRVPASGGRTRLVLPPDLAERVPADLQERLGAGGPADSHGMPARRPRRTRNVVLAAAVTVMILGTVAVLQANRGGQPVPEGPAPVLSGANPAAGAGGGPMAATVDSASGASEGAAADPAPTQLPVIAARVRVTPSDATIRQDGEPDSAWNDGAELSVAAGDTIRLVFSRPGYVTERVPFTGNRLSVSLVPDSVTVVFAANIRADVYLVNGGQEIRLGTTGSTRRLPSGTWRFLFRSPGQPDWSTESRMPRPGETYRVEKTDYLTTGGIVASTPGTWAMASLDGGLERETPAQWTDIAVGLHILRLSREGYRTIVDTIVVPAGQVLRRQYTLQSGF